MKLSNWLIAKSLEKKAVVLSVDNPIYQSIALLGTTVPASVSSYAYDRHISITFYPPEGENGLIAVNVVRISDTDAKRATITNIPVFLRITWNNGAPVIDIDASCVPVDKIGQAKADGIEVLIKRRRLKSKDFPKSDGDLLCRYLWGTAKAHEVLHAVVQQKLQPTYAQIIEQMTREKRQMISKIENLEWRLENAAGVNRWLLDQKLELDRQIETMLKDLSRLCGALEPLLPFLHFFQKMGTFGSPRLRDFVSRMELAKTALILQDVRRRSRENPDAQEAPRQ